MMVCEFSPRFVEVQVIFTTVAIISVLSTLSLAFHPVTFPNYALVGHTYRSLQGLEWLNCIRSCHEDPECFSYNFFHSTEDETGECQMINRGLDDPCSTERLVFSPGVVFQQIAATEVLKVFIFLSFTLKSYFFQTTINSSKRSPISHLVNEISHYEEK